MIPFPSMIVINYAVIIECECCKFLYFTVFSYLPETSNSTNIDCSCNSYPNVCQCHHNLQEHQGSWQMLSSCWNSVDYQLSPRCQWWSALIGRTSELQLYHQKNSGIAKHVHYEIYKHKLFLFFHCSQLKSNS